MTAPIMFMEGQLNENIISNTADINRIFLFFRNLGNTSSYVQVRFAFCFDLFCVVMHVTLFYKM